MWGGRGRNLPEQLYRHGITVPDLTGRDGKQAPTVEVATMDNAEARHRRRHSERDANDNRPR
jgi:hypothetical protein